jgi:hypothetical protein
MESTAITGDVITNGTAPQATAIPGMGASVPAVITDIFTSDEEVAFGIPGTAFTVMLARELSWGDQLELESAALRGIEREELERAASGKQTIILDIKRQRQLMLALRVRRWNVTRYNAVTQQNEPLRLPAHMGERIQVMSKLRPKWARAMIAKIEDLDRENDEAEPPMPEMLMPSGDESQPPKATPNGDTSEPIRT